MPRIVRESCPCIDQFNWKLCEPGVLYWAKAAKKQYAKRLADTVLLTGRAAESATAIGCK